jgi:hypothetical protein
MPIEEEEEEIIKCGANEVTDFVDQCKGVRRGCILIAYMFNIFVEIIDYY